MTDHERLELLEAARAAIREAVANAMAELKGTTP